MNSGATAPEWKTITEASYASIAETNTGTETAKAVTPDGLAGSDYGMRSFPINPNVYDGAVESGDDGVGWMVPYWADGWVIDKVETSLRTAGSTYTEIQLARGRQSSSTSAWAWTDILSTKNKIDASEYHSRYGTAGTINTSNYTLAEGDLLRIDVDTKGTGAKGLKACITIKRP